MMIVYDVIKILMKKLIRDKIPEIIKWKWEKCNYYIANGVEYNKELLKKIVEEAIEVQNSKNKNELIKELADINEVINSICENNWITNEEIETSRLDKLKIKWWFEKWYIYIFDK